MTTEQVIGLILTLSIMVGGVIGSVVPGLPGTPLVLLAAIGHRLYFQDQSASNWIIGWMTLLMIVSLALDYAASVVGAKKLGATWRGILGALLGLFAGMFIPIPGLILGPFLGALAGELLGGRTFEEAARAGVGALLGLLAGSVGKLACCLVMIGLFLASVWLRSGRTG